MSMDQKISQSILQTAYFQITGMHCAACAARVEKAVSALFGVENATVNLLQESLKATFAPEVVRPEQIIGAVRALGFSAEAETAGALAPTTSAPDLRVVNFHVSGMHCAACAARVEKGVLALPGIARAEVSLVQENLRLEYRPAELKTEQVRTAVQALGYSLEDEAEEPLRGRDLAAQPCPLPGAAGAETAGLEAAGQNAQTPSCPLASPGQTQTAAPSPDAFAAFLERQNRQEARMVTRLGVLRRELVLAFAGTIPLLIIGMGHMVGLPLPSFTDPMASPIGFAIVQLILALPAVWAGRDIFRTGAKQLAHFAPSMDSLVCLGAGAALIYSLWGTAAILLGHDSLRWSMDLYYESAAVVLSLVMLGRFLELRSRAKAGDALRALMRLAPEKAVLLRNGVQQEIPLSQVTPGDILLVRPGESVPVDGVVVGGESAVDESMLTGESLPVDKVPGATLTGGSLNQQGALTMRAEAVGADTVLARMARLVWEAQSSKAPISNLADRISLYFVPAVLVLAVVSGGLWYFAAGEEFAFALRVTIAVLVVACPCAMGLATPTSIMVGTGVGAQLGVLVRGGAALEAAGRVDTVVFDKTGTLTRNQVAVIGQTIFPASVRLPLPTGQAPLAEDAPAESFLESLCLSLAGSLGGLSTHPLSVAVAGAAKERGVQLYALEEFVSVTGRGVRAVYGTADQRRTSVALGNMAFMAELAGWEPEETDAADALGATGVEMEVRQSAIAAAAQGATPLFLAVDHVPVAMFSLAAPLRPEAGQVVGELKKMGLRVMLLSGDIRATTESVGRSAGIAEVMAEVRPENKEKTISGLRAQGLNVAMVGDGINDAPALAAAKVGIAVGGGAQAAVEAADIVLMRDDLYGVPTAIALGRATLRNIRQNLAWAFGYNILCLPVAAGLLYAFGGPTLSPMLAGAAMAFSSVSVVANALRLRKFKGPHSA